MTQQTYVSNGDYRVVLANGRLVIQRDDQSVSSIEMLSGDGAIGGHLGIQNGLLRYGTDQTIPFDVFHQGRPPRLDEIDLTDVDNFPSAQVNNVLYVAENGVDGNLGTRLSDPKRTIRSALKQASLIQSRGMNIVLNQAQTQGDFEYDGGSGHQNGDTITLSNGAQVEVVAQSAGAVTQFVITSIGSAYVPNVPLVQTGTSGSGQDFWLRPQDFNGTAHNIRPPVAIFLKAGRYVENNPLLVNRTTTVWGDNLRSSFVSPRNRPFQTRANVGRSVLDPTARSNTTTYAPAGTLLDNNRELLQDLVTAFAAAQISLSPSLISRCRRDVGFIVDAVARDITAGTTKHTERAAAYYYQKNQLSLPQDQVQPTIDSILELADQVEALILANSLAGDAQAKELVLMVAETIRLVNQPSSNNAAAASAISGAIRRIQNQVSNLINGDEFIRAILDQEQREKCVRDVGLILNAVVKDLQNGNIVETQKAALAYFRQSEKMIPMDQLAPTLAVLDQLLTFVTTELGATPPGDSLLLIDVVQRTLEAPVDRSRSAQATADVAGGTITSVTVTDPGFGYRQDVEPNSLLTDLINPGGYNNAATLLLQNRSFIQAEVAALVSTFKVVTVGQTEDDFVEFDESTDGGQDYAVNDAIVLSNGARLLVTAVGANGEVVDFVVVKGGLIESELGVPQTLTQDSTTGSGTDFELEVDQANIEPLITNTLFDLCKRDVGFVLDAVIEDLRHGNADASIEAAQIYWANANSILPQVQQNPTALAFGQIKTLSAAIIRNQLVPARQQQVSQSSRATITLEPNQTHSDYDGTGNNGTFAGGTAHAINDVLSLSNSATVRVIAVDGGGSVTEFELLSVGSSQGINQGTVLPQSNTTGSGTGFEIVLGENNLNFVSFGQASVVPDPNAVDEVVDTLIDGINATVSQPPTTVKLRVVDVLGETIGATQPGTIEFDVVDYGLANPTIVEGGSSLPNQAGRDISNELPSPDDGYDLFYVNTGSYFSGITFNALSGRASAVAFDPLRRDPLQAADDARLGLPPGASRGSITTSPYVQNCSTINVNEEGGVGMKIDGKHVSGLRSMVSDAFTQINTAGTGVYLLNRGYAQLVSIFTVSTNIGILAESGGFCSVANSNSSFGNIGLLSRGVSERLETAEVKLRVLIGSQDQNNYDGTGNNGIFAGGSDYQTGDLISLRNGAQIGVDTVDGSGAVTEFTVNIPGTAVLEGVTLAQTQTTGSGAGFSLTPAEDNIDEPGNDYDVFSTQFVLEFDGANNRRPAFGDAVLFDIEYAQTSAVGAQRTFGNLTIITSDDPRLEIYEDGVKLPPYRYRILNRAPLTIEFLTASSSTGNFALPTGTITARLKKYYTIDDSTEIDSNNRVLIELDLGITQPVPDQTQIEFYQRSLITSSAHTFEYIGSGTNFLEAIPGAGGIPIRENEVKQDADLGGQVFFTSTDEKGDFRIGPELTINRNTGTITGEAFERSLFAVLTPYILSLE